MLQVTLQEPAALLPTLPVQLNMQVVMVVMASHRQETGRAAAAAALQGLREQVKTVPPHLRTLAEAAAAAAVQTAVPRRTVRLPRHQQAALAARVLAELGLVPAALMAGAVQMARSAAEAAAQVVLMIRAIQGVMADVIRRLMVRMAHAEAEAAEAGQ